MCHLSMSCYRELHFLSDITRIPRMCLFLIFHLSVRSHENWLSCSISILDGLQFRNELYEKTGMFWIKVVPYGNTEAVS